MSVRWRCDEAVRLTLDCERRGVSPPVRAPHRRANAAPRSKMQQARRLLGEAARLQSGWGRVTFLLASLDEREGYLDRAVDGYLRAFQQGERHEGLTERLMQALHERKRFTESEQVLRLYERGPAVTDTAGAAFAAVPALGLKLICANPLAMLAVIAPTCEVVASMTIPCRPSGVSCRITTSTSPGLTKKVSPGMVKNLAKLRSKGSAGACETPLVVTKA